MGGGAVVVVVGATVVVGADVTGVGATVVVVYEVVVRLGGEVLDDFDAVEEPELHAEKITGSAATVTTITDRCKLDADRIDIGRPLSVNAQVRPYPSRL